jgi:nucleotide-binding universal stress UspA family protein
MSVTKAKLSTGLRLAQSLDAASQERIAAMAGLRRILFASDFSKGSGKAFAAAVEMAKTNRATLTVLHVIVPPVPLSPDQYVGPETWRELDQETRRWAKRKLDALTGKASKSGVRAAGLAVDGSPAQQIVRVAKSKRFDLVVIGTHGRTGLARFFLGSVAGRVVSTAPCPVLTVRS